MSNDISLPEAKFAHALDEYYGFLHKIVANSGGAIGPGQRLVTMNTITPYSILKDKPLYNMFILRAYADLVIRRSSHTETGSPKKPPPDIIDSANSGDAWSWEYFRLAFPYLMQELKKYIEDPAVQAEITALELTWDGAVDSYETELTRLETLWTEYAKENGISEEKDAPRYFRLKAEWWRKRRDKVQRLYNKQFALLTKISDLELAHLDDTGLLLKDLKDNISQNNQVKLPIRPELEDETPSDPTNSPGDYDKRPAIYPAGTSVFNALLDEKDDGDESKQFQRGYAIGRTKTTSYTHDTDWAASGSAGKFFFLKAKLSVAEKTHFEQQIKSVATIQIGFRAIQDVVIIRGRWYSGAFLKSELFQKWLQAKPEYREKLRNIITSVVVCRGLTVKLNFETDIHQNSWRELKVSGSGGLSVGGWNFGLSGHYNSRTEWDLKDITTNSVTFADGPQVCRIIGLRVEEVFDDAKAVPNTEYLDAPIPEELLSALASGEMTYGDFIDQVHHR